MKHLLLLNSSNVVLLDDEDFFKIGRWKWVLHKSWNHIQLSEHQGSGVKVKPERLENILLNPPKGLYVFHKNGNPFDCQRKNLILLTHSQLEATKPPTKANESGFKGVSFNNRKQMWEATIRDNNKKLHLGYYPNPFEAARVYNNEATRVHGEYAYLNDIENMDPKLEVEYKLLSSRIKNQKNLKEKRTYKFKRVKRRT